MNTHTDTKSTCDTDEFRCTNGACISAAKKCDRLNDCDDLSDEFQCGLCSPLFSIIVFYN